LSLVTRLQATESEQLAVMYRRQWDATASQRGETLQPQAEEETAGPLPEARGQQAEAAGAAAQDDELGGPAGSRWSGVAASKSGGKFWSIEQRGQVLHVTWGKVGSAGKGRAIRCDGEDGARREREKLIAEKRRKGYAFDDALGG